MSAGLPIESISFGVDQPLADFWLTLPVELTAMHAPTVTQDTATSGPAFGIVTGADQLVPLNARIRPAPSTAWHDVVVRQDSDTGAPDVPTATVALHVVPLKMLLIPGASAVAPGPVATQKVVETQETSVNVLVPTGVQLDPS